jgi:hypothetical protein
MKFSSTFESGDFAGFCHLLFAFFKRFSDAYIPGTSGLQGLFPQSGVYLKLDGLEVSANLFCFLSR